MDLLFRTLTEDAIAELLDITEEHLPARTRCRECGQQLRAGHCVTRMIAIGLLIGAGEWELSPQAPQDQQVIGS